MNNLEIANDPTGEKFREAYGEAETTRRDPINTAPRNIDWQLERFKGTSFDDDDVKAMHKDAMSV